VTRRGFTLLELIVVLGVMSISLAMLVPAVQAGRSLGAERETRAALQRTVLAIYGDPASGFEGFLGDMARLPDPALRELLQRGALAARQWTGGVAVGWSGPYLDASEAVPTDGWRNPLRLDADGRVRSPGPNGTFGDDDDLVAPAYAPLPYGSSGSACVEVLIPLSGGAARAVTAAEAVVYAVVPDAQGRPVQVAALARDASPCPFFFESLPAGRRLVIAAGERAAAGLTGSAAVVVPPGGPAAGRLVLGGST
jgi:prepilin-type N-terminal cleavage/methylation domain-containing protein